MKWISRITGVVGTLVLLAAAVLWYLSTRPDAGKMHVSTEFAVAPEVLFPWLAEGENAKKWINGLVETKPISGPAKGVGGVELWTMEDNGQRMAVQGTCTEYNPPSRLAVRLETPDFQGNQSYTLTKLPTGGTRLDFDAEYSFAGSMAKFMTPVIMPAAKKKLGTDFDRLKGLLATSR